MKYSSIRMYVATNAKDINRLHTDKSSWPTNTESTACVQCRRQIEP